MLEHIEFSHFGLAVDNFSKTKEFLFKFNYTEFKSEFDKVQNVHASLMVHEKFPSIEILSKLNKDDVTPIDNIIKNNNSAIYHMCFKCLNKNLFIKKLEENNISYRQITKTSMSPLFNFPVTFYMTESIGLIEIIEEIK